jgi:D-alanine-D-alanine ligase
MEKIAVLMGGVSNERKVSLASGRNVVEGLRSLGRYEVVPVVLDAERIGSLPPGTARAFIALHGGWGENGGVQAELDRLGIPYTGPGAAASRIAMDKAKTKEVLERNSVNTPAWALAAPDAPSCPLPLPAVVKPPCDGSSVGISKVSTAEEWAAARDIAVAAQGGTGDVLVEEYIPGREFTVPVLDGKAWSPIEIVTKSGWYGYDEKYKSDETKYPFVGDDERAAGGEGLADALCSAALAAYRALGCRGIVRVDFRVSPEGRPYVLELNTSPGFTSHSLVPKAGMRGGATFGEVCEAVLSCAACDRGGAS